MFANDDPPARRPETGNKAELDEDARGTGGEGQRNAEVTPRVAPLENPGQTSHPASPDDVGVPPDEELGDDSEE